jgi:DNA polymerase (family 10)
MATLIAPVRPVTNAQIARALGLLAQQLQKKGENQFKVRAYRRAAATIAGLGEGLAAEVRAGRDLTRFPNIGKGIAAVVRDLVTGEAGGQMELLLAAAAPLAGLEDYPRLDPKKVARAYKKLGISSVKELKEKLEGGEVKAELGLRAEHHFKQALSDVTEIYLDDAYALADQLRKYLLKNCGASRAEPAGAFRRRVETVGEMSFLVETDSFATTIKKMQAFAGGTTPLKADDRRATFRLPAGPTLVLQRAIGDKWGANLIVATGSEAHLHKLQARSGSLAKWIASPAAGGDEPQAYRSLGLEWIPPELREGRDEVELAARRKLPRLVAVADIKGELHAHSTGSDGTHSIEQMAAKARELEYDFIGITDHSQSLKIARGMSEEALWRQIRRIDQLNERGELGVRVLKSAEVDILANGALDYSAALLKELDYTVCSIHSRFALGKKEQTERIMRAMDNPYFNILGHTTGRLLLKRPGYEVDWERLIRHAVNTGVSFEINASPDRLDLSSEAAREVHRAGIKISINTDAHHVKDFDYLYCGVDVARRAGLETKDVLNCHPWTKVARMMRR